MKLTSLKALAHQLKKHTLTVYFVARDPRTPFIARAVAVLVVAYALSPIDLIPDFIPIIGYVDDILLIPLGLALVVHLAPSEVLKSAQLKTEQSVSRPVSYTGAAFIIIVWVIVIWAFAIWVLHAVRT